MQNSSKDNIALITEKSKRTNNLRSIWSGTTIFLIIMAAIFLNASNEYSDNAIAKILFFIAFSSIFINIYWEPWTMKTHQKTGEVGQNENIRKQNIPIMPQTLLFISALSLVSIPVMEYQYSKHNFNNNYVRFTNAAASPVDFSRDMYKSHIAYMRYGSVSVLFGNGESKVSLFLSPEKCREYLVNNKPSTTLLTSVMLGDEKFNGWPKNEVIEKYCSNMTVLTYKR